MIKINIPGYGLLELDILVLDYNGTLALDGCFLPRVKEDLMQLAELLEIHIVTSDTFGSVTRQCEELPVKIKILESGNHSLEKAEYLDQFGARQTVVIGNGANDLQMMKKAALGILIIGPEGCSGKTLCHADIITTNIADALGLLLHPQRLIATLRK